MKHCPQCNFLYLDSDQLCDLDKTPFIADSLGKDAGMFRNLDQKAAKLRLTAAAHQRKLNLKTVSAATVSGLIIGLMLLLSYQRMRPTLQARQAPPASPVHASRDPDLELSPICKQNHNKCRNLRVAAFDL